MNLLIYWLFVQCFLLSAFAEEYLLSEVTDSDGIVTTEYVDSADHSKKLRTEVYDPWEPSTRTISYYDENTIVVKVEVEINHPMNQIDIVEFYNGALPTPTNFVLAEVTPFTKDRVITYSDLPRTQKVKEVIFPTPDNSETTTINYDAAGVQTSVEIENPEENRFTIVYPPTATNGEVREIYRGTKLDNTLEGVEVATVDGNTVTTYKDDTRNIILREKRVDHSATPPTETVFYYDETTANNLLKFCSSVEPTMDHGPVTICYTGDLTAPEFLYLEESSPDYRMMTRYLDQERTIKSEATLNEYSMMPPRVTHMYYDETPENVILFHIVEIHSSETEGYVREHYNGPPENAELERVEVGSADHQSEIVYKDLARTIRLEQHTYSQDTTNEIRTIVFYDGTPANVLTGKKTIERRPIGSNEDVQPIKEVYKKDTTGVYQLTAVEVTSEDHKSIIVYRSFADKDADIKYQIKSADREHNPKVFTRVTYDVSGSDISKTEIENRIEETYTVEYADPAANSGVRKQVYHGTEEVHTLSFVEVVSSDELTVTTYVDEAQTMKAKEAVVDDVTNPTLTVTTFYDATATNNVISITKDYAATSTEAAYTQTFGADGVTLQAIAVSSADNKVITVYSDAERTIKQLEVIVDDAVTPTVRTTTEFSASGEAVRTEREELVNRKYSIQYPPRDGNGGITEFYEGTKEEHRFQYIQVTSFNHERVTTYLDFDRTVMKTQKTLDDSMTPPRTTTVYFDKTPENRPRGFTIEYPIDSTSNVLVKEFYSGTVDYSHLQYVEVPSPDRRIISVFADIGRTMKVKEIEVDNPEHPNVISTIYYDPSSQMELKKEITSKVQGMCRVEYPTQPYVGKKTEFFDLVDGKKHLVRIEVVSEDHMSMTKSYTRRDYNGARTEYYINFSGDLNLYRTELLGKQGQGEGSEGGPDAGPIGEPVGEPYEEPNEEPYNEANEQPNEQPDGPDGPNGPYRGRKPILVEDCNGGFQTESNVRSFECDDYATGFKVRILEVDSSAEFQTRTTYYDVSAENRVVKKVIEDMNTHQYMVEYAPTAHVGVVKAFYNSTTTFGSMNPEPVLNHVEVSSVDGKTVTLYGAYPEGSNPEGSPEIAF